ncbi:hypothetical protein GA0074692_6787 [Micromonospora pallida]|uniref:Uncharacterized protein n=1 Tax=Micromonospora pallida TaxID=145854 RepID=A0A1C6TNC7_9ACTN|nr:hypothetical protein [Micromonospora pallida]SCL43250.1 hypothetical protein GA0074692_6787 [Micromonospora pallida]
MVPHRGGRLVGASASVVWTDAVTRPGTRYGSLQITVAGGGSGGATANAPYADVTPGARYRAVMWAYVTAGTVTLGPAVDWRNAAGMYMTTAVPTPQRCRPACGRPSRRS